MRPNGNRADFPVSKLIEIVVLIVMGIVAVAACASGQASKPADDKPGTVLKTLPAAVEEQLSKAVGTYLVITGKLANDSMDGVADQAKVLADRLNAAAAAKAGGVDFGQANPELAAAAAKAKDLSLAVDIAAARKALAEVSDELVKLVDRVGVPASVGGELFHAHCPMYRAEKGGVVWIQKGPAVRNPYFGKQMLTCADQKTPLPLAVAVAGDTAASQPAAPAR